MDNTNPKDKKKDIYDSSKLEVVYLESESSRLEESVGEVSRQVSGYFHQVQDTLQSYIKQVIQLERKVEKSVSEVVPKQESLVPASLYVGVATLGSSILVSKRNLLVRMVSPIVGLSLAGYYFLPQTTTNIYHKISTQVQNLVDKNQPISPVQPVKVVTNGQTNYSSVPEVGEDEKVLERKLQKMEKMYNTRKEPNLRGAVQE